MPDLSRKSHLAILIVAMAGQTLLLACESRGGRQLATIHEVALDQQTIEQLRSAGSNLSKTHTIDFYLYLPSQQDATTAASALQTKGFNTAVREGADGKNWLCLAQKQMVPTIENLTEARQTFTALATDYRGEYDGWEAAVEP